ncbi:MAG: transposase, partial [Desulfobacula sp.]|nr:transposase [Desulfobacula sp.]
MSKRKQYSKQFKKDAINLIIKEGYKISEAARNLDIHH